MLGKAVKIRHCPATVSATVRRSDRATAEGLDRSNHWSRSSGKVIQFSASQETGPLCASYRVPRGTEEPMQRFSWRTFRALLFASFLFSAPILQAVTVHGTVTDTLGRPIPNATVALVQGGKVIVSVFTQYDGTYQLTTAAIGQFYILAGGTTFRELTTGSFYGGELDAVEQNVVLEPEWVRQSIVVTATGVPQPQAQVSASVSVINKLDFINRAEMVDPLRQVP